LLKDGVSISYSVHGARDNPFTESCNGHFKEEYQDELTEAKTFKELKLLISKKVRDWNSQRIHSALKGRSPDKFIRDILKI
jgi:transposase InsO family protein